MHATHGPTVLGIPEECFPIKSPSLASFPDTGIVDVFLFMYFICIFLFVYFQGPLTLLLVTSRGSSELECTGLFKVWAAESAAGFWLREG